MSIEQREARQPWILLTPALTAIVLLLIVPLVFIVVYSFWLRTRPAPTQAGFFLDNWQEALTDPFYRDILLNTLKIAAITTVACAVLGYPAAYFIARSKGNKAVLLLLLMLPFWISYIIRTMSWINILGVSGRGQFGLIWDRHHR
jgi:spermidine/putrescine transport system permease protein